MSDDTQYLTKEDLVEYLKKNLKLDVKSQPLRKDDRSVFVYTIGIKLDGELVSQISFNA